MNYSHRADKYINNASMSNHYTDYPIGPNGDYYYLSHPPLGIIVPYALFRVLGYPPNALGLQWFNMILQFLCALMIYVIVLDAGRHIREAHIAGVLAAGFYIWLPGNLWFLSNTYFVEMFVQTPLIASVFLAQRYCLRLDETGHRKWSYLIALGIAIFGAAFTEWTGVLLGATLSLWALIRWKERKDWALLTVPAIAVAIAMAVFVVQSSLIVGFEPFVKHELRQFLYRSIDDSSGGAIVSANLGQVIEHYLGGAQPVLLSLLLIAFASIPFMKRMREASPFVPILFFTGVPALLHHLILLRYSAEHWYSMLKGTYFLCFALAAMVFVFIRYQRNVKAYGLALTLLVPMLLVMSGKQYVANYAERVGSPHHYKILADVIIKHAGDDEVVFLKTQRRPLPQLVYYARRNLQAVRSVGEARDWLAHHPEHVRNGIVFSNLNPAEFERIRIR